MNDRVIREANALYEALENEKTLEQMPIFIRIGQTRAVLITEARYRELTGQKEWDEQTREMLQPLRPEIEAFQRVLPELLQEHKGEWVAIHKEEVVAIRPKKQDMLNLVVEKGYEPVYIQRIQVGPRIVDVPGIEMVR